jgi:hypothetical protein
MGISIKLTIQMVIVYLMAYQWAGIIFCDCKKMILTPKLILDDMYGVFSSRACLDIFVRCVALLALNSYVLFKMINGRRAEKFKVFECNQNKTLNRYFLRLLSNFLNYVIPQSISNKIYRFKIQAEQCIEIKDTQAGEYRIHVHSLR